jgi:hypothetical protein
MADDKRPLVSPRSPSFERAQKERAHPSPPGDEVAIAALSRLAELEHDAARTLAAAGEPGAAAEHTGRAARLGELVAQLGGSAPRVDESRNLLTPGGDLRAQLAAAYAEAAATPQLTAEQRAALERLMPR